MGGVGPLGPGEKTGWSVWSACGGAAERPLGGGGAPPLAAWRWGRRAWGGGGGAAARRGRCLPGRRPSFLVSGRQGTPGCRVHGQGAQNTWTPGGKNARRSVEAATISPFLSEPFTRKLFKRVPKQRQKRGELCQQSQELAASWSSCSAVSPQGFDGQVLRLVPTCNFIRLFRASDATTYRYLSDHT